jgi:glyoxylase I family protein
MKKYSIEHIGISVRKPIEMAHWYRDVLRFNILLEGEDSEKGVAFITDADNKVMLELGKLSNISPLCEKTDHHLQIHIALKSEDPDKEAEYLVSKGAKYIEKFPITLPGAEKLISLMDPWGNTIQLARRKSEDGKLEKALRT